MNTDHLLTITLTARGIEALSRLHRLKGQARRKNRRGMSRLMRKGRRLAMRLLARDEWMAITRSVQHRTASPPIDSDPPEGR